MSQTWGRAGTCRPLCPATAKTQHTAAATGKGGSCSALPAPADPTHEIISETNSGMPALGDSASLQGPRHKTKASQGSVITTLHC